MKYFSYGSNMSIQRIQQRVPSAQKIGMATLKEHILLFHKVSIDGSGKCNAFFTGNKEDNVIGVLFNISEKHMLSLDKAEGLGYGYEKKEIKVFIEKNIEVSAITYKATKYNDTIKPYSWYKKHVLSGAKDANFPAEYIKSIEKIESIQDKNNERVKKELRIYE